MSQLPRFSPTGEVAAAQVQVSGLAEVLWSAQTDDELVGVVDQVARLRAVLAAVEAGVVAEVEARGVAKSGLHFCSTADWLTHVGGLRRGDGCRVVTRAQALTGALTATRRALVEGVVSPDQADVIVAALDALPSGDLVRRRGEQILVEHAASLNATELARAGRHLAHVVDPDRAERRLEAQLERDERAAHHARCLSIVDDGAGGVRVKGRGSVEDGAVLRAALLPLTSPVPAVDPTTGQELHDPRDHGARLWDALVATAQHSLDTDAAPQSHGSRPRIAITLDQQTLTEDRPGHGVTDDGLDLPAGVVRRLACDADLIPAVLGTHSEVLDVGRRHRLVTAALWTALVLRDRHCAFPACTRPPVMCHAHHIVHWVNGGVTALHNLVVLCGHHHRVIHDSPWEVRLDPSDGKPEFRGPPALGRSPTWLRNRPRLQ